MRLPFRRKQRRRVSGGVRNKAFDINRKSDKTIRKRKQSKVAGIVSSLREKKSIIYSLMGAVLLIAVIYLISSLLTNESFRIKSVEFIGNTSLTDAELQQRVETFVDRNIFLTRTSSIETALLESDLYFEDVRVQKFLPDQVRITLRERQPNITLINFNGVFLTDDDGTIVEIITRGEINLSPDDIDIIKGLGNPNADYVKQRVKRELMDAEGITETTDDTETEETEELEFDFTAIPLSKKVDTLNQIRSELLSKASEIHSGYAQEASRSIYAGLPRVYVYANDAYELNDSVDLARLELTNEARSFFAAMDGFIIERVIWESRFIVTFSFTNGKTITFSTQRDYSEQLEDFSIIHEQLRISGDEYSNMDLSSSKVSVK